MAHAKLVALATAVLFAMPTTADASPPAASSEARPFAVRVPAHYDPRAPTPLVILLHGYGSSGPRIARYFGIDALADAKTFLVTYPDGTRDPNGDRFWNATEACCNFKNAVVDDVAYIAKILDAAEAKYNVDTKRIFVVGHSNGGFFAHRLACEMSTRIAGIVSVAGATWKDAARCNATAPVAVLQAHGTHDDVIRVRGGRVFGLRIAEYPAVTETLAAWATHNGCSTPMKAAGAAMDLVTGIPGAETHAFAYGDCRAPVELWRVEGAGHIPNFSKSWGESIYAWLMAHPKR